LPGPDCRKYVAKTHSAPIHWGSVKVQV